METVHFYSRKNRIRIVSWVTRNPRLSDSLPKGRLLHRGSPLKFILLDYIICTMFLHYSRPLMTSHDLWPLPKMVAFFLLTWQILMPNMKSVDHCYLELSFLQTKRQIHTYIYTHTYKYTHTTLPSHRFLTCLRQWIKNLPDINGLSPPFLWSSTFHMAYPKFGSEIKVILETCSGF